MSTNLLNSDKGQNFLPPPSIFLSEATSDGEDSPEDNHSKKQNYSKTQGPRLIKCEAVLTDVEYSSDEEANVKKYVSPLAANCSSESRVVERIFEPISHQFVTDELTDTENLNVSDDDELLSCINEVKEEEIDLCEEGVTTISDQVKTNSKTRNRFGGSIQNSVGSKFSHANYSDNKNYLTPVNKLGKKKKRKGKLLLESCLTDTEDVDVPSDNDEHNRTMKKDTSYTLFPSQKEEQVYTDRIKHTSTLRRTEKYSLQEFLTNKIEEDGVTDIDDLFYSDCEDALDNIKDTEYELDFSNEVSNRETVLQGPSDRKTKKKRNTRNASPESQDTDDEPDIPSKTLQRMKSTESQSCSNYLSIGKSRGHLYDDDISNTLTDTEDVNYSDGECSSSRPKCPTPDMAFFEDSTVFQNESVKIMQALEVISDADPLTDCEEIFLAGSSRKSKGLGKKSLGSPLMIRITGDGLTDTEELILSDIGRSSRNSNVSDVGDDSSSETDVEVCSNLGDVDEVRRRAPSITPDCLRNMDNTYISNIEGSEAYLKQVKGSKSRSLSGPLVIRTLSPSPAQDTDSEDIQASADEIEEFTYNRSCTPSNYFEKFNLEDQCCVIHEKNTRSFQTDGDESLHIKDGSYQQDPVTDCEDVPLVD